MKYLPHILLPPILVALIAAAIYLPKYYQFGTLFQAISPISSSAAQPEKSFQEHIAPFLKALDLGDLAAAENELGQLKPLITMDQQTGLSVALISARQFAKTKAALEKAEREQKLQQAKTAEAIAQLEKLKQQHARETAQFHTSLATLTDAAESAAKKHETAEVELSRLRKIIEDRGLNDTTPTLFPSAPLPAMLEPLKVPGPMTVHFKKGSTNIPDSIGVYVDQMGEWLSKDQRLGISLGGKFQSGFSEEQNKTLTAERTQHIRERLEFNGATEDQIEIIPLEKPELETDSEEQESAPSPAPFGFVELLFFER